MGPRMRVLGAEYLFHSLPEVCQPHGCSLPHTERTCGIRRSTALCEAAQPRAEEWAGKDQTIVRTGGNSDSATATCELTEASTSASETSRASQIAASSSLDASF